MRILYDHQIFSSQKFGGVSKYFCELMKNIPLEYQFQLSVLFTDNHYLKEDYSFFKKTTIPLPDMQFKGKSFLKRRFYFLNQCYSKRVISSNSYDLFHPTFYESYFIKNLKKPYIITVHDLIEFKNDIYTETPRKAQMEKTIKNANRIISISQNTKNDLVNILNIPPEKIDVVYHGYNKPTKNNNTNPYGRYILFVGRRGGYKNFKLFIKAVSSLLNKVSDLNLICVGEPFNREEILDLKMLNITRQTTALTVNENLLNNLYSNALIFVFPSLYEGFGMPILEAFANNCPVCLSNTSSLTEVAGDAGVYFDPNDQDSILDAIEKIINNADFSRKLTIAGAKRLNNFSWKKCAAQTINSYEKAFL